MMRLILTIVPSFCADEQQTPIEFTDIETYRLETIADARYDNSARHINARQEITEQQSPMPDDGQ